MTMASDDRGEQDPSGAAGVATTTTDEDRDTMPETDTASPDDVTSAEDGGPRADHEPLPPDENTPKRLAAAQKALQGIFGFDDFREPQKPIIDGVLRNENMLVVMPTGAGKSLLYQLPALARPGLSIVVSPLKSLMKDQVDKLRALGLYGVVEKINSDMSPDEQADVIERIRDPHETDRMLLYVSPERFGQRSFMDALMDRKMAGDPVRLFAVDEAHCISQWGHDFRPDYQRIARVIDRLEPRQILGMTATATPDVRADILSQLGRDLTVVVSGFRRDNLTLTVRKAYKKSEKLAAIKEQFDAHGAYGIVYCSTQKNVDAVWEALRGQGIRAARYHGGMSNDERAEQQEAFEHGRAKLIVATNAFGMGVDKPDVRFIVHYNIPGSIEAYYQEAGRAGRDGKPSTCVLLYSHHDLEIQRLFLDGENPSAAAFREVYGRLIETPGEVVEQTRAEMAEGLQHVRGTSAVSTAIKQLEDVGLVKRLHRHQSAAGFRLIGRGRFQAGSQRATLYRFLEEMPGIREGGINVDLAEVEQSTGIPHDKIRTAIKALEEKGVLRYEPPFRGGAVRILNRMEPNADGEMPELPLDWDLLVRKREHAEKKLDQMIGYAEQSICRHKYLLDYFGDTSEDCGEICDVCLMHTNARHAGNNPGVRGTAHLMPSELPAKAIDAAFDILALAKSMNGIYGGRRISQVLAGSKEKQLTEWKLDRRGEYGKYAHLRLEILNRAVDSMTAAGLLETYKRDPGDKFFRTRISERGEEVLARRDGGLIPVVEEILALSGSPLPKPDPIAAGRPSASGADGGALYSALRARRQELSKRDGVPPYRIASNATLEALVERRPVTKAQLKEVKGIGPATIKSYGADLLAIFLDAAGDSKSESAEEPANAEEVAPRSPERKPNVAEKKPVRPEPEPVVKEPVAEAKPKKKSKSKAKKKQAERPTVNVTIPKNDPAFDERRRRLKLWRYEAASAKDVPPFEIVWDEVLDAIAVAAPRSVASLETVQGVTAPFAKAYGRSVIQTLRDESPAPAAEPKVPAEPPLMDPAPPDLSKLDVTPARRPSRGLFDDVPADEPLPRPRAPKKPAAPRKTAPESPASDGPPPPDPDDAPDEEIWGPIA